MSSGFPENYPMAVPTAVVQPAAQPNYALWAGAILAFLIIGVIIIIVASQSKNSTVSASVNSSAASSDSSDETDSSSDTISVPIDDSAHLGISDSGLPPSDAAKNAADAANKIAIADVAISIANGASIYCTGYNPKGAGAVYRYVSPKTIQWYPNPTIAISHDPNWIYAKSYDCTGFTLGPDLARAATLGPDLARAATLGPDLARAATIISEGINSLSSKKITDYSQISLKGGRGNQYCADDSDGVVRCNRSAVGAWEQFSLALNSDGSIGFIGGRDNKYCADDSDGVIRCNRSVFGPWEKFKPEIQPDGSYAFIGGRSNKYCADDSDGVVRCNRSSVGPWEKFKYSKI